MIPTLQMGQMGRGGGPSSVRNRVLALHMTGANGSTSFYDVHGHAFTAQGNAQISTAQTPFSGGGGSGLFAGGSDRITTPNASEFAPGSGDLCARMRVRPASFANYGGLFYKRATNDAGTYSPLGIYIDITTGKLGVLMSTSGTSWGINLLTTTALSLNTWADIEVDRVGTAVNVYINGVSSASGTISGALMTNSSGAVIGATAADGTYAFNGYIGDFEYYVGAALHSSGFTPSSTPFLDG